MRIGVVDLTTQAPEIADLATAGQAICNWLSPAMPGESLEIIPVSSGASLPRPQAFDAFVISGSEMGVYDDTPWMAPLRAFLLQARDNSVPLFGICFGHQVMADTFGGKAELSSAGERIGVERFGFAGAEFEAHVWHRDQVTLLPPSARVLGAADYCLFGVLAYEFAAASVQFHPELDRRYMAEAIRRYSGVYLEPDAAARHVRSVEDGKVDPALFASLTARVLRGSRIGD